jgi:hypothetical protein
MSSTNSASTTSSSTVAPTTSTTSSSTVVHPLIVGIIKDNYNAMDANNKKAADVMLSKGGDAAASYMLKSSGMDYANMRSMYG